MNRNEKEISKGMTKERLKQKKEKERKKRKEKKKAVAEAGTMCRSYGSFVFAV